MGSRRDLAQERRCQRCPFCPVRIPETDGLVLSVCPCPTSPLIPRGLGKAEGRFCAPGTAQPKRGLFSFLGSSACRSARRALPLPSFAWQSFLLWAVSSPSSAAPVETLLVNSPSPCFCVWLLCWGCLSGVPNPAGPCFGTGPGLCKVCLEGRLPSASSRIFHEIPLNFPGSAGGDGIVLPAVTDRAVTEFCAVQLLVLFPLSSLNLPGPGSSSKGKQG